MHDVIVVGSGASGVGAALGLVERGVKPLMLDVGYSAQEPEDPVRENFYTHRRHHDRFDLMVGHNYSGLANMLSGREVPVKLTAPFADYVTRDADELSPIDGTHFAAIQSFSRGGLANAWGAGLYRFTEDDLADFPVAQSDLDPYFDRLTREIGIAGAADDLEGDFGACDGLIEPLRLSGNIARVFQKYESRKRRDRSIRIGRARIAALTAARDGRPAYEYNALEFFQEDRSLYSPRYSLDRMIRNGEVDYRDGWLVESWREEKGSVCVTARPVDSDEREEFRCRALLLAAGAINTSRIVLASAGDFGTTLPLLENPALQFPLVLPLSLGRRLATDAFGLVQLNLVWDSDTFGMRLQGSIMEITAPARAEFFAGFPMAARDNLALIRRMLPAMLVMQLFFPGHAQPPSRLSLQDNGRLRIEGHPNTIDFRRLRPLLRFLLKLGAITHPALVVRVPTGHSVHYAATLPMKERPGAYECSPDGRLAGTDAVYVADSAAFTSLPAKNMSFAMMANAMRVATIAAGTIT